MERDWLDNMKRAIKENAFFKDSFWAVLGNGGGYGLLLLAGIIIARLLGKDLYGEYGFIKTTMFQFAAFSTLGLGYTSTKFIAQYKTDHPKYLGSIVKASISITTTISVAIAVALFSLAQPLSMYLNEPTLASAFRWLSAIIVFRAISTTQFGIISGFGSFKSIAVINILVGVFLLFSSAILTYFFGLKGSLIALSASQILCVGLCFIAIRNVRNDFPPQEIRPFTWEITRFSIPVALQELTFALGRWLGFLIITKLSSLGEVGLFTAAELWYSVALMIPAMLYNVMLSHLSASVNDPKKQGQEINMMLAINLVCTLIPFLSVYLLSSWITSFYGPTFHQLGPVIRIFVFASIFTCCSNVLTSELIAQGRTWPLFTIRCMRDVLTVALGYYLIHQHNGIDAAKDYATSTLICAVIFFLLLYGFYKIVIHHKSCSTQ